MAACPSIKDRATAAKTLAAALARTHQAKAVLQHFHHVPLQGHFAETAQPLSVKFIVRFSVLISRLLQRLACHFSQGPENFLRC